MIKYTTEKYIARSIKVTIANIASGSPVLANIYYKTSLFLLVLKYDLLICKIIIYTYIYIHYIMFNNAEHRGNITMSNRNYLYMFFIIDYFEKIIKYI